MSHGHGEAHFTETSIPRNHELFMNTPRILRAQALLPLCLAIGCIPGEVEPMTPEPLDRGAMQQDMLPTPDLPDMTRPPVDMKQEDPDLSVDMEAPDLTPDVPDVPDAPKDMETPPPPPMPYALMALGYQGEKLRSCDKGRTWEVIDPGESLRCDDPDADCGHGARAPQGLAHDGSAWFAAYAWGNHDAVLERSLDGTTWEEVRRAERREQVGGLVAQPGVVVGLHSQRTLRSTDGGNTWTWEETPTESHGTQRHLYRFALSTRELLVGFRETLTHYIIPISNDGGLTWRTPNAFPTECSQSRREGGGWFRAMVATNNVMLLALSTHHCTSTDHGNTFTAHPAPFSTRSLLHHQGEVWAYTEERDSRLFRSADGITWQESALDTSSIQQENVRLTYVFRAPDGVFVAHNGGQYETRELYRSEDGLSWQSVATSPGHRIRLIESGPNTGCP